MKQWFGAIMAFSVISAAAFAAAPQPTDRLLDQLVGRWILSGTIAGKQTTHDVTAEWVLNHGYVRLHEVSREKGPAGAPAYEAIVFISFDPGSADYTCLWLDSTGSGGLSVQALGHAKPGPSSLPFVFKDPDGRVSFENTFSYDQATDSWAWLMDNVQNDKREPFGRVKLVRQ